ncbi:molybdenum ABC transporter ATP-binding protein [Magnetospira thiophila]
MISVELHLSRGVGDIEADFRVPETGLTALVGPDDSDNLLLLKMIAGLVRPDHGRISIGERVLFDSKVPINLSPEQRRLAFVPRGGALFPHLSVRGNLLFGRDMGRHVVTDYGLGYADVIEILALDQILDHRVHKLTSAQKAAVSLGRALLMQPQGLLLDHPSEEILEKVRKIIQSFNIPVLFHAPNAEAARARASLLIGGSAGRFAPLPPPKPAVPKPVVEPKPLPKKAPPAYKSAPSERHSLLTGRVWGYDSNLRLTRLEYAPGRVVSVAREDLMPGEELLIRIPASEVGLSLTVPEQTSYQNILEAQVVEIAPRKGVVVEVLLDVGAPLRATVTKAAVRQMGLTEGKAVYALFNVGHLD